MPNAPHSLEPGAAEMREMLELAGERIIDYIVSLPEQPAADIEGSEALAASLVESMPEQGQRYEELLELLFGKLVQKGYNTAFGGALSYVPGGGLFHSAVADLISLATNRYVNYWAAAPGLAQLEDNVVRWFCDMVGLPASAGGVLTTGASMGNLGALVTARRERLGDSFLDGVLYVSEQVHHSIQKSAVIVGFSAKNFRVVPTDERFRIRVDVLEALVEKDLAAGLRPFCIVGNAGTTNTGAVDDLPALAALARKHSLWFHVDAAYGGFFLLTPQGREALRGMELADTVSLDPHKGLFLPFGTGCLLARDVAALERSHQVHSEYLTTAVRHGEGTGHRNIADLGPEQSREFRGLRVWLPLKMAGAQAFRSALEEKLELTRWLAAEVGQMAHVEMVAEPQLSIFAFRFRPPGLDEAALDLLNQGLVDRVNEAGPVHLAGTSLRGHFVIRVCVLSVRTHRDVGETFLRLLREAAASLVGA